jgi:hypothetical protein
LRFFGAIKSGIENGDKEGGCVLAAKLSKRKSPAAGTGLHQFDF